MADVAPYVVKISDDRGATFTTLTNALNKSMSPIMEEMNGAGSFTFVLGLDDPQASGVTAWAYEVLVLRDGNAIFGGPIIGVQHDPHSATATYTCAGLLAYFDQRCVDRGAGRSDLLLTFGDFEQAADGDPLPGTWSVVEDPLNTGIAAEIDDGQHVSGARSAKVSQPTPGANSYILLTVSVAGGAIGQLLIAKAWFRVDPATYAGPAIEQWGLVLHQDVADAPNVEQSWRDSNKITSDTPRGEWVRVEETIAVKASTTADIEVRCYAPAGIIWWDGIALFEMESFSPGAATGGEDQATILKELVLFLQGTHPDSLWTAIKSDLRIVANDTSCPSSGVVRFVTWQFADHVPANTALTTFCGLDDGLDIWVLVDPATPTTRTFFAKTRGTDRSATVTLTHGTNCILGPAMHDGRQAANEVTQLWLGDGPDREEAQATDPAAFGGVTLQQIQQPKGSPSLDSIQGSANKGLAVALEPVHYEVELIDPIGGGTDLRPLLGIGDIVDSAFSMGALVESRHLKIVTRSINPLTDTVTVGLNVAP